MSDDEILVPIVRESLRAIVADEESCRLLKQALINSGVIVAQQNTVKSPGTDKQHTQLAITALRSALSRLPIKLNMVDQILVAFDEELQQQTSALRMPPCPSFNSCHNDRKNDKCFAGHPFQ